MTERLPYYRFLEAFWAAVPELAAAPPALVIGDLHIENFGTWRDRAGRLAWGVNDCDEIDVLPYTIDLVRLGTSALLAIDDEHLSLAPADACAALRDGWRARSDDGFSPYVLGERHPHLYRIAAEAIVPGAQWARKLRALAPYQGTLPRAATRAVAQITPWDGWAPTHHRRVAGVGSLGSRRIALLDELAGSLIAREVKQIPGPASRWLWRRRSVPRGLAERVATAREAQADPARDHAAWSAHYPSGHGDTPG